MWSDISNKVILCPAGPTLIAQTPSGDIRPFSLARKSGPARILGQSESRSYVIILKQPKALENTEKVNILEVIYHISSVSFE